MTRQNGLRATESGFHAPVVASATVLPRFLIALPSRTVEPVLGRP